MNDYIKNFIKKNIIFTYPFLKLKSFKGYTAEDLKLIKYNQKYKDIHKGERCFILGNGPSILQEDLSLLKNEKVFVVNQAAKTEYYAKIGADYHVCVDDVFFKLDPENPQDSQAIESFRNLSKAPKKPVCFFPAKHRHVIEEKYKLDDLECSYFVESYRMTDNWKKSMDYTKVVPAFGTVVQYCITLAIYMGFKEIYLLGCDNTGLMVTFKSILQENTDDLYSYKVSDAEKKRMEKMVVRNGLEGYCESYLFTLQDYRKLASYCRQNEIELYNCSARTVIDSVNRISLKSVLKGELEQ